MPKRILTLPKRIERFWETYQVARGTHLKGFESRGEHMLRMGFLEEKHQPGGGISLRLTPRARFESNWIFGMGKSWDEMKSNQQKRAAMQVIQGVQALMKQGVKGKRGTRYAGITLEELLQRRIEQYEEHLAGMKKAQRAGAPWIKSPFYAQAQYFERKKHFLSVLKGIKEGISNGMFY